MNQTNVREHIKKIDINVEKLREQGLDRTDLCCSLMQAKSIALLALVSISPFQNKLKQSIGDRDGEVFLSPLDFKNLFERRNSNG